MLNVHVYSSVISKAHSTVFFSLKLFRSRAGTKMEYVLLPIGYRCEDKKKTANSLFEKIPIITLKEQTVQTEDASEDIDFKLGFEIIKF
jgi:hypothetical protein